MVPFDRDRLGLGSGSEATGGLPAFREGRGRGPDDYRPRGLFAGFAYRFFPDDDLEDEEEPRELDIRAPDPDTANFPNGAYTIPRGRVYFEASPLGFFGRVPDGGEPQYSSSFLLRYGLTDELELRLFGNGLVVQQGKGGVTGWAPIAFDLKAHFWDEIPETPLPAVGLEVYVLTQWGAPSELNTGVQPGINLLFDHTLPYELNFEWNLGVGGVQFTRGDRVNPSTNVNDFVLQWSLQRGFGDNLGVFTHGYLNNAALPRFGDGVVVGGGFIYYLGDRTAVFGSANAGLNDAAPETIFLLGGAVAF
jgi:hypothetical protein